MSKEFRKRVSDILGQRVFEDQWEDVWEDLDKQGRIDDSKISLIVLEICKEIDNASK